MADSVVSHWLPFGLGYHPYFRVPFLPGDDAGEYRVSVPAGAFWELQETLPTGRSVSTTGWPTTMSRSAHADLTCRDCARPART